MKATLTNNNKIEIKFAYRHELVSLVKGFEGRQYSPTTRSWFIPIQGAMPALEKLARHKFDIDPAVVAAVKADERTAQEAESLAVMDDNQEFKSDLPLYPFQRVCSAFMVKTGSCLNACGVGTGKTIMNIVATIRNGTRKNLVVAPKSLLLQWQSEINRFAPQYKTFVVSGNKKQRDEIYQKAGRCNDLYFLITSYELARIDWERVLMYESIIIDEAHRAGNTKTKTHKALHKISQGSKHRYLSTATPLMNRPTDLYGILDLIQNGCVGRYWDFLQKYTVRNQWGGVLYTINQDDLKKKLKRYMVRKTLEEVAPELPSMILEDICFDLSDKEIDLYKKIKQEILFAVEKEMIDKIENPMLLQHTLVKLIVLVQLVCSCELIGSDKTSTKLEVLKERLEDILSGDDKVIVFTRFKKMSAILERELKQYKPLLITGDVTGQDRADNLKKFQEGDQCKILISTDAGGEGLNIDRANIIFHYDLPYSYGKYTQRNGRIQRLTQKKPMIVYNLLANKSIDLWLSKMIKNKSSLSDQILTLTDIQSMLEL